MNDVLAPGCYCKKCSAPVNPKDEKCPNGHILKEVGKHHVVVLEEKLGLSDEVKTELTKTQLSIIERASKWITSRYIEAFTINLGVIQITIKERKD